MSETLRTWTLEGWSGTAADPFDPKASGFKVTDGPTFNGTKKVYEASTVDAERELLREIAQDAASPVFEDSRVKYVEIQIDREAWERLSLIYEHNRLSGEEGSDGD